jgi:hypothetical protein
MKKFVSILFFVLFISETAFSGVALAQFSQSLSNQIDVVLSPENPEANQTVTATAQSYGTDLDSSNITWKVNGKTEKSGSGLKTFSFTTGSLNSSTLLTIIVKTSQGDTITQNYTITPTAVDLIWQSEGYTPPFYKGKTLFSHQNKIEFIAVPHINNSNGQEIPAKNLIYKWTKNGVVIGDFSGYGKNTYTTIGSIISRDLNIEVDISSADGNSAGYASVSVSPIEPSILFYQKDPLYGIQFQKALTETVNLPESGEMEVLATPFYFGTRNIKDSNLSYTWSINGQNIDSDTTQISRVFRKSSGASGTSLISLSIANADKILQFASNSFSIKLEGTK